MTADSGYEGFFEENMIPLGSAISKKHSQKKREPVELLCDSFIPSLCPGVIITLSTHNVFEFMNISWCPEKYICLNLRKSLHSYKIVWSVCNSGNPYLEIISLRNETERGCIHFGGNLCSGFLQCYLERSCGVLCLPMIHGGSSYEKGVVNNHG